MTRDLTSSAVHKPCVSNEITTTWVSLLFVEEDPNPSSDRQCIVSGDFSTSVLEAGMVLVRDVGGLQTSTRKWSITWCNCIYLAHWRAWPLSVDHWEKGAKHSCGAANAGRTGQSLEADNSLVGCVSNLQTSIKNSES